MAPPAEGGIHVAADLSAQRKRLASMESRLRDLTPALKVIAQEVELRTDDALARSASQEGKQWPALRRSTLEARARRSSAAARRRQKRSPGRLTAGAKRKRAAMVQAYRVGAPSAAKALIDTGRLRTSQRARVVGQTVEWSAVGYIGPHMVGASNGRPPKRNPTCFELRGLEWALNAPMALYIAQKVRAFVMTGRP